MNKKIILLSLIFLFTIYACSSDDDNGSVSGGGEWVVYLHGSGDQGIDIEYQGRTFCYDDGECSSSSGFSFVGTFGDSRLDVTSSDADRTAVGVLIEDIDVTSGSGFLEVTSNGSTLFTSEELNAGDNYTLEFGELDNL